MRLINGLSSPVSLASYTRLSSTLNKMPKTESESEPKPRRGRPRDPERCRRIMEAARTHFYTHGLERASVDAIAADAGVSKMTIYSHFGSKEGLFEAVVRERTERVVGGLEGAEALDPRQPVSDLERHHAPNDGRAPTLLLDEPLRDVDADHQQLNDDAGERRDVEVLVVRRPDPLEHDVAE